MTIQAGTNRCRWEEDECYTPAHGGEFYCLTHLEERELMSPSRFLGMTFPPPSRVAKARGETE